MTELASQSVRLASPTIFDDATARCKCFECQNVFSRLLSTGRDRERV